MKAKCVLLGSWFMGLIATMSIIAIPGVCYSAIPSYILENLSPAVGTSSVDLAPDGERYYARHNFGAWDEGYVAFDADTHQRVDGDKYRLDLTLTPRHGQHGYPQTVLTSTIQPTTPEL